MKNAITEIRGKTSVGCRFFQASRQKKPAVSPVGKHDTLSLMGESASSKVW